VRISTVRRIVATDGEDYGKNYSELHRKNKKWFIE
jgi:hypothetical protein